MTDAKPREGKYCPLCSTMARPEATHCVRCGHRFSTGLTAEAPEALHRPLAEAELNRTRMFTLPAFLTRPAVSGEDAPATVLSEEEVADLEKSLETGRRGIGGRAFVTIAALILVAGVFLWWLVVRL